MAYEMCKDCIDQDDCYIWHAVDGLVKELRGGCPFKVIEEEEENKEMNEECEEESYRTIRTRWPAECSGCLYRDREYIDEIGDYVECIHPIFSRKSYQCPVRMTAMAKKKFGRTVLDDYI